MKTAPARTLAGTLLGVLGLFASLSLPAAPPASKGPGSKPLVVTYFFLPG